MGVCPLPSTSIAVFSLLRVSCGVRSCSRSFGPSLIEEGGRGVEGREAFTCLGIFYCRVVINMLHSSHWERETRVLLKLKSQTEGMFWHEYDRWYLGIERIITPPVRILRDEGKVKGGIKFLILHRERLTDSVWTWVNTKILIVGVLIVNAYLKKIILSIFESIS